MSPPKVALPWLVLARWSWLALAALPESGSTRLAILCGSAPVNSDFSRLLSQVRRGLDSRSRQETSQIPEAQHAAGLCVTATRACKASRHEVCGSLPASQPASLSIELTAKRRTQAGTQAQSTARIRRVSRCVQIGGLFELEQRRVWHDVDSNASIVKLLHRHQSPTRTAQAARRDLQNNAHMQGPFLLLHAQR